MATFPFLAGKAAKDQGHDVVLRWWNEAVTLGRKGVADVVTGIENGSRHSSVPEAWFRMPGRTAGEAVDPVLHSVRGSRSRTVGHGISFREALTRGWPKLPQLESSPTSHFYAQAVGWTHTRPTKSFNHL